MAYFEDMSFSSYSDSSWVFANNFPYVLLNIGWLDEATNYSKGHLENKDDLLWKLAQFTTGVHIGVNPEALTAIFMSVGRS